MEESNLPPFANNARHFRLTLLRAGERSRLRSGLTCGWERALEAASRANDLTRVICRRAEKLGLNEMGEWVFGRVRE